MSSPINFTLMDKELSKPFFTTRFTNSSSLTEEAKPFSFSNFSKSLSSALPQTTEDTMEINYSALTTLDYIVDSDLEFSDTESESSNSASRSSTLSSSPVDTTLSEDIDASLGDSAQGEKCVVLFKTEMCKSFVETGVCRYGKRCKFAHGEQEQRMVHRHPKYKTQICRNFKEKGSCPYGQRCCYRHSY